MQNVRLVSILPTGPQSGPEARGLCSVSGSGLRWMWDLVGRCRQHLVRFIFPLLGEKNVASVSSICSAAKW